METNRKRKKVLEQAAILSREIIYLVEMRKELSDNNSEEFKNWMCFMIDPYKYKEELCQDPAFSEAYEELDRINADPVLRAVYDAEEKQLRDQLSTI